MGGLLRFLFTPAHALVGFLIVKALTVLTNGFVRASAEVWTVGVLALVVYGVIAWFAHKGRLVSIWAVVVLMLVEGADALVNAAGTLETYPLLSLLEFIMAVYLIIAAYVVFAARRRRSGV